LIGSGRELKFAERAVEKKRCPAMGADFIILTNSFPTRSTKSRPTLVAETVFQEKRRLALRTCTAKSWRLDQIDF
jgi:hypothetical protein